MKKEVAELREVITKLVPMLVGKQIRVTQEGSKAFVEADPVTRKPKRVNIPSIPDTAEPDFIAAIQGFIDHECSHCLHTDWDVLHQAVGNPNSKSYNERLANLVNLVEDTMIERRIVEVFPGARYNLEKLHNHFIEKITKPAVASAAGDMVKEFEYLILPMTRALAGHQAFVDFMDKGGYWKHPVVEAVMKMLDPKTVKQFATIKTTKDSVAIARDLETILYPPQPPQQSDGDGDGEPDPNQKGKSQDKPDKKAGKGNGDGERDHSDQDPSDDQDGDSSDADNAEGDSEGKTGGKSGKKDKSDKKDDKKKDKSKKDKKDASEDDEGDDAAGADGDQDGDQDAGEEPDDGQGSSSEDDGDEGDGEDEGGAGSSDGDDEDGEGSDADSDGDEGDDGDSDEGEEGDGEGAGGSGSQGESDEGDDGDGAAGAAGGTSEVVNNGGDAEPGDAIDNEMGSGGGGVGGANIKKTVFDFKDDAFTQADMSKAMSIKLSEEARRALDKSDYNVFTKDNDRIEPLQTPENMNARWVPALEEEVQSMTGKMQKDLERMMAAQSLSVRVPGYRSGRLHAANLHRLKVNDDRVFNRKHEHKTKETAITLLCDNSGSMSGSKLRLAMVAAYALSSTLERVGMPSEILGFTTGHYDYGMMTRVNADGGKFHRTTPIVMPIYKDFNERISSKVKQRIAYMANAQPGLGANIDGESLEYAAIRLMKRREARKVILVLSDGAPAGAANAGPHLKKTAADLNKMGIDTVGIGIMDSSVQYYYDRHVVLNDVASLPAIVMNELRQILQK